MKYLVILLALGACAQVEAAREISLRAIDYYCAAGDAERNALRDQFTTEKGPLVQVNCENLPDAI